MNMRFSLTLNPKSYNPKQGIPWDHLLKAAPTTQERHNAKLSQSSAESKPGALEHEPQKCGLHSSQVYSLEFRV